MKKTCLLILTTTLLFQLSIYSQVSTQQQKKLALVIGNGNYVSSSILANPENDARSMKVALQRVGFTVMEYENLTQGQMKKAIDDFGEKLKTSDVGLFFYAGHGIQAKGYNYLIPIDAKLQSEQQVEYDCVQADRVLALMEASGSKVNIIILDACRNNPFERSWTRSATGRGLAFMNAPSGTLIAYATSPGTTASDGSGNNGLYTSAILESMKIPNITIIQMFQNVRSIVSQKSSKQQIPWESTSMTGDFYFTSSNSTYLRDNKQAVNKQDDVPSQTPIENPIKKTTNNANNTSSAKTSNDKSKKIEDALVEGQRIRQAAADSVALMNKDVEVTAQKLAEDAKTKGTLAQLTANKSIEAIRKAAKEKGDMLIKNADERANKLLEEAKK